MEFDLRTMASVRCANAFGRMFWGFLFLFDLTFGAGQFQIDLLPTSVGWLIIASALNSISDLSPEVKNLRSLAYWLGILSIPTIVQVRHEGGGLSATTTLFYPIDLFIGPLISIAQLIFVWRLCQLVTNMAQVAGNDKTANRAKATKVLFIVHIAVTLPMVIVVRGFSTVPNILIYPYILAGILIVIVIAFLMGLMKRTEDMCMEFPGTVRTDQ